MDSDESTDTADRDWTRLALIAGCVVAAVTAALLAPTISSDGIRGSPIDSVLPGEPFETQDGQGAGAGGSGFGALNPGDRTGVGGETGLDRDTFASNDTDVHFEVESSQPAYWRTGTYGTYTGSGWERDVGTEPYDGSIEAASAAGEQIAYDVELARAASALPTAWQPTTVDGIDGLAVTETGSVLAPDGVEAGTTFSGTSLQPERGVDVLRGADGPIPEPIREQYTQLPDDTPTRVGEFSTALTEDDGTTYDAARSIQDWLRSEKGYSLQASRQSDSITDTFIFEMEQGYCEYFATAMTTMLRTQGIPARYTVGYTSGQSIGENRYQVRGMNAHAWVEVYFPEVGWVRFDPTPGDSRLRAQQDVLQEQEPDSDYAPAETGSPGEVFTPDEIENVADDGGDDRETGQQAGVYNVSLNRTAVPGEVVEVTVSRNGSPVPVVGVSFNGERIGVTDEDGSVVGTVPPAEELRIGIEDPYVAAGGLSSPDTVSAPADPERTLSAPLPTIQTDATAGPVRSARPTGTAGPLQSVASGSTVDSEQDSGNETVVDVETNATVSVRGDRFVGSEVTVVATVQGITIPDAAVFLDGQQVGETNASGEATVTLPEEARNSTIRVQRGPIFGERTVRVRAVELAVDTGLVVLPFTDATVEVTANGEGLAGAPVAVDGDVVAETDSDGTAAVGLPFSESVTVTTTRGGITREATVDRMVRNAVLLLVGVGVAIGLPVLIAYRRGYRLRDLRAGLRSIAAYSRGVLAGLAGRGGALLRAVIGRVSRTLVHVARLASGERSIAETRESLGRWLGARRQWLSMHRRWGRSPDQGPPADEVVDVPTVRDAWDRFLDTIGVSQPETHTPGELATHAIENGHPREPVETLRDAFRDVEYGDRDPTHRAERIREAIRAIERETAGDPETPAGEHDSVSDPVADGFERPAAGGED